MRRGRAAHEGPASGRGCLLCNTSIEFEHDGFEEDRSPPDQTSVDGWEHFHGRLAAWLTDGEGMPW